MKDVLVYMYENALNRGGGAYAVGYYLHKAVSYDKKTNIKFLQCQHVERRSFFNQIQKFLVLFFLPPNKPLEDVSQYNYIHFHGTYELFLSRKWIKHFNGKILLQEHSPEAPANEMLRLLPTKTPKIIRQIVYSMLCYRDAKAFQLADILVFPCFEAEEPCRKYIKDYNNIREAKIVSYYTTGIDDICAKKDSAELRNSLNIPSGDFVISYVGRHNIIKGYDILKSIAETWLANNNQSWFIVAGKESPLLSRLDNKHWIEYGYTNDPYSFVGCSDVFFLPNRDTYFDIVMIEALALGIPVIASRTGGNKYFERNQVEGVFLYSNESEALDLLTMLYSMRENDRKELGRKNREYYQNHLTSMHMLNEYEKMIEELPNV